MSRVRWTEIVVPGWWVGLVMVCDIVVVSGLLVISVTTDIEGWANAGMALVVAPCIVIAILCGGFR